MDSSLDIKNGIYVADILQNSIAKKNGLKIGDIIEKIDDVQLNKVNDLKSYIYTKKKGEIITLTIIRSNRENEIQIELN